MRSSSAEINISAVAPRLDVDNRISLRFYYRIANNILRQADIFRREKNIVDLYIMLLRFSSLVLETIPHHRDYKASLQSQKDLKKKLLDVLSELEKLKPVVRQRNIQLEMKQTYQANMQGHLHENDSLEWHAVKNGTLGNYNGTKAMTPASHEFSYQFPRSQKQGWPVEEQFRRMSVNFLFPKEETLSKHSIFGPNGLYVPRKPPKSDTRVQYPTNIDFTAVEIPSLHPSIDTGPAIKKDQSNSGSEVSGVEESLTLIDDRQKCHAEDPCSLISFEEPEALVHTNIIRQPSPPAVLAEVQDLIPAMSSQVAEAECRMENSSTDGFVHSESPLQLHISTTMMENFMKLAKSNTDKNLETCGVLAGSLENRKFFVTALIIPKQESTSDTCQTTNEEEIFEVQDKRSLFPLGWIHTHPSQSCFMSSVDLHTHYSYQIMLPEAVAVVMAPRDTSRSHGIFRLTTPGGMSVIRQCQQRGFHSHNQPTDGGPIYASCTDVYMNPNLKFDVIDLR